MQIENITVKVASRTDVLNNEDYYNSNNFSFEQLPKELQEIETPIDKREYARQLTETAYHLWKPIIARMAREVREARGLAAIETSYPGGEIILSTRMCGLLKQAVDIGIATGRIAETLKEDLEDGFIPLLQPFFPNPEESNQTERPKYFIRLNDCSPKDGIGNQGPFSDAWSIALSLCTSIRIHRCLRNLLQVQKDYGIATEILHLIPWREDMSTLNEFRIFVPPNGKVRAISQYSERNGGWADDSGSGFGKVKSAVPHLLRCVERFQNLVGEEVGLVLPKGGYVMDVHAVRIGNAEVVEEGGCNGATVWLVEPIELNSFGAQLASGSGIFNWLDDWRYLYGQSEELIVAVVSDG
ncbi:hypothetical protein ABW19_dt0201484 [Dactylella cylindrospora]|nr:hypothetical protein ABW19_dt0201484 [Dactylella cylindrospora]